MLLAGRIRRYRRNCLACLIRSDCGTLPFSLGTNETGSPLYHLLNRCFFPVELFDRRKVAKTFHYAANPRDFGLQYPQRLGHFVGGLSFELFLQQLDTQGKGSQRILDFMMQYGGLT